MSDQLDSPIVPTGIGGLDDILRGGYPENCLFLITGSPGTGLTLDMFVTAQTSSCARIISPSPVADLWSHR